MELSVTLSWLSRVEHQSAFNLMGKGKSVRSKSNGMSKVLEAEKKLGVRKEARRPLWPGVYHGSWLIFRGQVSNKQVKRAGYKYLERDPPMDIQTTFKIPLAKEMLKLDDGCIRVHYTLCLFLHIFKFFHKKFSKRQSTNTHMNF